MNFELIKTDPLLTFDDEVTVVPMEKIKNLTDYWKSFSSDKIFDVQPVRDFSFWLDFVIKKNTGLKVHHLTNFLIWFSISLLLYQLFLFYEIQHAYRFSFVALFFFHPALISCSSWVSARKHLLALFFVLLATIFFLKALKKCKVSFFIVPLLYLLSIFSQPIMILWSVWALVTFFFSGISLQRRQWGIFFFILLSFLVLGLYVNYQYYAGDYVKIVGHVKMLPLSFDSISLRVLLLGRSFFQALFPYWANPASYDPGSILNLIGIIPLVLFFYGLYKLKDKLLFIWSIFAFLPLWVVVGNLTIIFGMDCYLLGFTIGLYLVLALFFNRFKIVSNRFIFIVCLLLLSFIFFSSSVLRSYRSDFTLFERAYKVEPTPFNLRNYIAELLANNHYREAFVLSERLFHWSPNANEADHIRGEALSRFPSLSVSKKIELIYEDFKLYPDSPWLRFYLATFLSREDKNAEALQNLDLITNEQFEVFGESRQTVLEEAVKLCSELKKDCARFKALRDRTN